MSKKPTGLAAFTGRTGEAVVEAKPAATATAKRRGAGDTVALTVRVSRGDWQRMHQLAMAEGISLQQLMLRGISGEFKAQGLPGIESP